MPKKRIEAHPTVNHGRKVWRVIVPKELNGGKRTLRFFGARSTAEQFAIGQEQLRVAKITQPSLADVATFRRLADRVGGIDTLEKAVDFYLKNGHVKQVTLAALVAECIESRRRANRAKSYLDLLDCSLNRFARDRAAKLAHEVTASEIETWLHGAQWANATKQGYLKDVRTLFSFALRKGYTTSNPALAVDMPQGDNKAPHILAVSECAALMQRVRELDSGLIPYFALCLFAGIRPSEVRRLTWAQIKEGHVEIQAAKAKTKQRRLVTINPTLGAWLALKGELPPKNFRRRFRKVVAGLNWKKNCMRHSFVTYHLPIHGIAKTALEAGHSEQILFAHYRELTTLQEAEKFWKIKPEQKNSMT